MHKYIDITLKNDIISAHHILESLTDITSLSLDHIKGVSIENLKEHKKIKYLTLKNMEDSSFDDIIKSYPQNFKNLKSLDITLPQNRYQKELSVPAEILKNLEWVRFEGFTNINLEMFDPQHLNFLALSHISHMELTSLKNFKNLHTLYLGENGLTDISFLTSTNISTLSITHNPLIKNFEIITNLQNLHELNLRFNNITQLLSSFKKLEKLEFLYLDNNNLVNFSFLEDLFKTKNNLSFIHAKNNQIQDLKHLKDSIIYELYVDNNHIEDLSPLENLPRLDIVHIENNPLKICPHKIAHIYKLPPQCPQPK
jgi:internalin A